MKTHLRIHWTPITNEQFTTSQYGDSQHAPFLWSVTSEGGEKLVMQEDRELRCHDGSPSARVFDFISTFTATKADVAGHCERDIAK